MSNYWKQVYIDKLTKEERLLKVLAKEYDRISKQDSRKLVRKKKVKEIREQCQKIRNLKKDYYKRLEREEKEKIKSE